MMGQYMYTEVVVLRYVIDFGKLTTTKLSYFEVQETQFKIFQQLQFPLLDSSHVRFATVVE